MEEYRNSVRLLGLLDQNLPVFKEKRVKRLRSIEKINNMLSILPRLAPNYPEKLDSLDPLDPEFEDKMIYPVVNWQKYIYQSIVWAGTTYFFAYNWNVLSGNKRLRLLKMMYPPLSVFMLGNMIYEYNYEINQVYLFDAYVNTRTNQLLKQNQEWFDHPDFEKFVYFMEDYKETMSRVHRQANNHDESDFKDSELTIQDFIRRHSNPENPEDYMFTRFGAPKVYN